MNYKSIVEKLETIIFVINSNAQITYVSPYALQVLGYNNEDVINTDILTLFEFAFPFKDSKELASCIINGKTDFLQNVVKIKKKSLEYLYVDCNLHVISDKSDENEAFVFVCTNERIDNQYECDFNNCKMIIENQTELICSFNKDFRLNYANKKFCDYFEVLSAKLIGENLFDFVFYENRNDVLSEIKSLDFNNPKIVTEYNVVLKNDSIRTHRCIVKGIFNLQNEIIEYHLTAFDITDLKIVEDALRQRTSELEILFKAFPDLFFRVNSEGVVLNFMSGATENLFLPPQEFIERKLSDVLPENISEQLTVILSKTIETQVVHNMEYWLTVKGENKYFEARILPVPEEEAIIIVREITDRKKVEDELNQSKQELEYRVKKRTEELEKSYEKLEMEVAERLVAERDKERVQNQLFQAQKMEALGVLAGGIAHDFNNLMAVIQGYAQMLMWELDKDSAIYKDLNEINEASIKASNLTRQLLIFSRQEPMEKKPLNLNTSIEETYKMASRIIGEDIKLAVKLEEEIWPIFADAGNIDQVLMNLIVNARDAMPDGGNITIKTKNVHIDEYYTKMVNNAKVGNYVNFSIEDNGIGMDEQTVKRIFEPFFTTKGPTKGTGLGLSVVYGIIEQHNGWMEVNSEKGEGTKFDVYLPAYSIRDSDENNGLNNKNEDKYLSNNERILIIEDEKALLVINERVLKNKGYITFSASNYKEAQEIFKKENGEFDVIFSDVVLPDGSGLNLVDEFMKEKPHLKAIMTSGYTGDKSNFLKIQKRNINFLQKPYNLTQLFKMLREVLDGE